MVTGRRPFAGDSNLSILAKILYEDPAPPSTISSVTNDVVADHPALPAQGSRPPSSDDGGSEVALQDLVADSVVAPAVAAQSGQRNPPGAVAGLRHLPAAILIVVVVLLIAAASLLSSYRCCLCAGVSSCFSARRAALSVSLSLFLSFSLPLFFLFFFFSFLSLLFLSSYLLFFSSSSLFFLFILFHSLFFSFLPFFLFPSSSFSSSSLSLVPPLSSFTFL